MAYTILIADDSKTARLTISKALKLTDLPLNELHLAENGRQALEIIKSEWIDLLITDINMPEMDGIELVHTMADKGLLAQVPVVVISTEGSQERIAQLQQWGISGYLRKPFTPEQVKSIIEGIIGDSNGV